MILLVFRSIVLYYYLHGNVGGGLKLADDLMSRSGATRYCEANSLLTASGSSANICILMNGSFPFCVSICHGLGRVNKSETLPCDKPKIHSPNSLWLMEFCESASLTCVRRVIGIISTRVLALFLSLKVSFLLTSLRVISALIGPFLKKLNKKNALSTAGVLLLGMGYCY